MNNSLSRRLLLLSGVIGCTFCLQGQVETIEQVYSPVKVATPPSDAYIGLSLLDNGEIRHYNYGEQSEAGTFCLSSIDKGLTWTNIQLPGGMPYADVQSPVSKEYIRLVAMGDKGVYCIRTQHGLDEGRTLTRVSEKQAIMIKPPVFIRDGKRVIVAAHNSGPGVEEKGSFTYVSDDDGQTWTQSNVVSAPDHTGGGFHKGIRWNHGAVEPTVLELKNGTVWMIMRTAQDTHYSAYSEDGGLTWGTSKPSPFYGTITMPTIGRLKDGRLLFLWCNTTPLPEREGVDGVWDDVFTNRDAIHATISEDEGETWIGMRELYLNPLRNAADYAFAPGIDRGVHQSQFVEVAPGKILVSLGQNNRHRSMLLFDVKWLYDKQRTCHFDDSLSGWSTFNYYKGIQGHCGYNRVEGCRLCVHPDDPARQVLNIPYIPNDTLVSDNQGAVWNFPVAKAGELSLSLRIPREAQEVKLLLNDRWFNPSDTVARYSCMYLATLSRHSLGIRDDRWHTIRVAWDLEQKTPSAYLYVDGKRKEKLPLRNSSQHGLSYLHLLSGNIPDEQGLDIEWVEQRNTLTK